QIPFFMAAYHFLSNLSSLEGCQFLFINDLSKPDRIFVVNGLMINILPILMTIINILSGMIYSKGFKRNEKVQLYVVAGLFLVLLYNSPSGLVLYWTMNNMYSLVKNIIIKKTEDKLQIAYLLLQLFGIGLFIYGIFSGMLTDDSDNGIDLFCQIIIVMILTQIPTILHYLKTENKVDFEKIKKYKLISKFRLNDNDNRIGMFVVGLLMHVILLGGLISSSVISASVEDFIEYKNLFNPNIYIINNITVFLGFAFWVFIMYLMMDKKSRTQLDVLLFIISVIFLIDFAVFGNKLGLISNLLVYDKTIEYSIISVALNALLVMVISIVLYFVWNKKVLARGIYTVMLLTVMVITVKNCYSINSDYKNIKHDYLNRKDNENSNNENYKGIIPLSKNGKNVVVIMLDRAIGAYVPYIMEEKPELKEKFSGFTYYPNTVSFGTLTNFGSPALYGGYEYCTKAMEERNDVLMKDKHNEALLVMPRIFSDNGFNVTVIDPPFANYVFDSDLSIYEKYPEIKAYHLESEFEYEENESETMIENEVKVRKRSFVGYSFTRIMPLFLQSFVYDDGNYYSSFSQSNQITNSFRKAYEVLNNLDYFTKIKNDDSNNFMIMDNNTTHEPCRLQLPNYDLVNSVTESDKSEKIRKAKGRQEMIIDDDYHYHINMVSLLRIADWLDYLKENGVYNNTRIILVADHGFCLRQFDNMIIDDDLDVERVNPLLMVKDFNSKGFKTDNSFMTNGDTPTLSMQGVIENPINPFTNNEINSEEKKKEQYITLSEESCSLDTKSYTYQLNEDKWYTVKDNILDKSNWKKVDNNN
ncbi:MAG: YidC/Oxa1 family membrane protein insertase, partial [Lachnospiraceae bacterium]|nr:YidC/Oxa1 family membrane protein insertase [Lachnospiraceae bacterium]